MAGELIKRAKAGEFNLTLSQDIIDEARATLRTHKKMREKYRYSDEEVAYFFSGLQNAVSIVSELPTVQAVRDPNDDFIIATSVKASADYLVAWDNDLLALGTYSNILIITPKTFLKILKKLKQEE